MQGSAACGRAARRGRARRRPVAATALAAGITAGGLGVVTGGCGLVGDAATSATAPLTALPATDVVVETNLQTELTMVGAAAGAGGAAPSQLGSNFVSGPSEDPAETSYASPAPGTVVIVGYNAVTRDCLGIVDLLSAPAAPVLGESAAGEYYFVQHATPSGGCAAATFAALPTVPAGWSSGDPSSAGWPAG